MRFPPPKHIPWLFEALSATAARSKGGPVQKVASHVGEFLQYDNVATAAKVHFLS